MPLYKPSALRAFLEEIGASPKKSLSQNFLIDGNIIRKIVTLAHIQPGDFVLEIGPGPGVLTEELLARGAHVLAVEKDRKFAEALHRLQTRDHRLTVVEGDILEQDLSKLLPPRTKLVANLPYQITTPILTAFLPMKKFFESITVMVQKEVAARFTAFPSTSDYSSITVFVQFYSDPEYGFTVEPTCFYPPPRVKSAVVKFKLKDHPVVSSEEAFFAMTRRAFQQRRKMIRSSLKLIYDQESIDRGLEKIGKGLQVRPENLSLGDFLILSQEIHQK
ncbi:MAG TPA: 16S rRNA (adenine(1518)-N(6)/adenine(1519)-N(6))-dimethyltransferase RsmA [Rhabdochlamydiaceae bacterium]|jgi:16S rRNA (adenine1518-N6/adenine1519-N6)-dimethyltransferase|nr:16S rRNA (adenine(1518)-N(6)/adenine(1519)-N(6))-dimethyltransferase RsmA [Rhabdochlamydiaceae bacterium]